jgi:hypothetical protein
MNRKLFFILISITLFFAVIPQKHVYADTGPSVPWLHFNFQSSIESLKIVDVKLLYCEDKDCTDYWIKSLYIYDSDDNQFWMRKYGYCEEDYCRTPSNYGVNYYQLEIKFDDISRVSNIFSNYAWYTNYNVLITESDLVVEEKSPNIFSDLIVPYVMVFMFIPAFIITLITEYLVVRFYSKKNNVVVKNIIWVNCITVPTIWFLFTLSIYLRLVPKNLLAYFLLPEVLVIVFEGIFLFYTNRMTGLTKTQASVVSIIANSSSFIIGNIIIFPLIF